MCRLRLDQNRGQTINNSNMNGNVNFVRYPRDPVVENQPSQFRQYVASLSVNISAMASGAVLAWTSPILLDLQTGKYRNIKISRYQVGWIGSLLNLGAMLMCLPTGISCDFIGRKKTLLLLVIPFTVGWLLIMFANNVPSLYLGRFITGMAVGSCSVAAPLYISEIVYKPLGEKLTSYFQGLFAEGVFIAFYLIKYLPAESFTVCCAYIPIVFVILFSFQPESPVYLSNQGKFDEAKAVLVLLRGSDYKVDAELEQLKIACRPRTKVELIGMWQQDTFIKACIITFLLIFFQQFSGINVVILYFTDIFRTFDVHLHPVQASVVVGFFQMLGACLTSSYIQYLGRKFLLFVSALLVSISTLFLAMFFTLKYRVGLDENILKQFDFLPIGALIIYVIAYSIGLGPIPLIMAIDMIPPQLRNITTCLSNMFSWFLAFLVSILYFQGTAYLGLDSIFYMFGLNSLLGVMFIFKFVPETKGKTLTEIQALLKHLRLKCL